MDMTKDKMIAEAQRLKQALDAQAKRLIAKGLRPTPAQLDNMLKNAADEWDRSGISRKR